MQSDSSNSSNGNSSNGNSSNGNSSNISKRNSSKRNSSNSSNSNSSNSYTNGNSSSSSSRNGRDGMDGRLRDYERRMRAVFERQMEQNREGVAKELEDSADRIADLEAEGAALRRRLEEAEKDREEIRAEHRTKMAEKDGEGGSTIA